MTTPLPTTEPLHALGMNGNGYVVIPKWFVSFLSFTVSVVFVGAILWAWQMSSDMASIKAEVRAQNELRGAELEDIRRRLVRHDSVMTTTTVATLNLQLLLPPFPVRTASGEDPTTGLTTNGRRLALRDLLLDWVIILEIAIAASPSLLRHWLAGEVLEPVNLNIRLEQAALDVGLEVFDVARRVDRFVVRAAGAELSGWRKRRDDGTIPFIKVVPVEGGSAVRLLDQLLLVRNADVLANRVGASFGDEHARER